MKHSGFKDFTRGGQTSMHAIRMFIQSIRYIIILAILVFVAIFASLFTTKTQSYDRYIGVQYLIAKAALIVSNEETPFRFEAPNGRVLTLPLNKFYRHRDTKKAIYRLEIAFSNVSTLCLYIAIITFIILISIFKYRGRSHRAKRDIRGVSLASPQELAKDLKRAGENSKIELASVPLKKMQKRKIYQLLAQPALVKQLR